MKLISKIAFQFFSLAVSMLFVAPANAQVFSPGGELNRVMSGPNTELAVRNIYGAISNQVVYVRDAFGDIIPWVGPLNGGYPAIPGHGGHLGRAVEFLGAGAALGYGINGTGRGVAIGAGIGLTADIVASAIANRHRGGYSEYGQPQSTQRPPVSYYIPASKPGGRGEVLDCSKKKNQKRCNAYFEERERERQESIAQQQAAAAEQREVRRLSKNYYNTSEFPAEVIENDTERRMGTIRPGASIVLPESEHGYRADLLIPDRSMPGRTIRRPAGVRLAKDWSGWVFTAPNTGGV